MKCFIMVFKIAHAGIVLRSARVPRTAVGLRQARAGATLAMGQRGDSVVSIPQPKAQLRVTDFHDSFVCRQRYRPYPDGSQRLVADKSLEIRSASVEEDLSRRPEIELPDVDGFFAALILRLVRGVDRSRKNRAECQCSPDERHSGSGSTAARAAAT